MHGHLGRMLDGAPDEALRRFLERWHDVRTPLDDHVVPAGTPRALRRLHQVDAAAPRLFSVNRLLRTGERDRDGDMELFYAEEQWVAVWGVRHDELEADDPPVWCREYEPSAAWHQDAPSVSVFLLQLAVFGAALTAPHSAAAAWLPTADADRALAPLDELVLPSWHWPAYPSRFYAGDDVVAFTCPNGDEAHRSVWVGGLTPQSIRFLEPHLSDAWDLVE